MNSLACGADFTVQASNPGFSFTKSSCYDFLDAERLKMEQSATSDLPMQKPAVQIKQSPFARSAAACQSLAEQAATMGCLPAFATQISFAGKSPVAQAAAAPRRRLLPPPKTAFLPAGDPTELRYLILQTQQKRSQTIEKARITSRLQTLSAAHPQMPRRGSALLKAKVAGARVMLKRFARLLGDLFDKLAVA